MRRRAPRSVPAPLYQHIFLYDRTADERYTATQLQLYPDLSTYIFLRPHCGRTVYSYTTQLQLYPESLANSYRNLYIHLVILIVLRLHL